ncbi:BZ3500_MvSof-1268-A1-R1_Chr5-2g07727 [Microbotryum saponariae]|uniref:BZ3500_MvSof-1268-A1-R1_Chr5-2g07727 protein n=1 Tax=Microbotryum saponariae TaxID=289078 RepID=A0A2X0NIQ2_9BASI|nr:BZ3500_MvSof-1268-A1-R1_Chr5-2g07727 [Microbotryum saponariae]SDA05596.1 BZ3501_MvSof-1269-A2-R1_Chr5-2g07549 [Microbotryum saponariae]
MSGYPGANRPHGHHHTMMPDPNAYNNYNYNNYGPPPPGPPPQGYYGGPPPPQQYGAGGGYDNGGGGGYNGGYEQQSGGYVPTQPPIQSQYAPPSGFPGQQAQYNGPPPTHYGEFDQNQGPSRYQGDQFQVHQQPVANAQMYSNCSGKRKALSIGINYTGTSSALRGCINDSDNMIKFICERYHYKREDVVQLTDRPGSSNMEIPTRANILRAMQWLVSDAQPNDSLFFHYSGHGGQAKDLDGDEDDGYDETIYPVDFKNAGQIIDDEMHAIMVARLPQGCRLTAIFDSCHSGSALDLPYIYSTQGKIKEPNMLADAGQGALSAFTSYARGDLGGVFKAVTSVGQKVMGGNKASQITKQTKSSMADVISWSGCKDSQTSADTSEAGKATGALSFAFIDSLTKYPQQSYVQLLNTMRDSLRGKYDQKPQLSCSHELDTSLLFVM